MISTAGDEQLRGSSAEELSVGDFEAVQSWINEFRPSREAHATCVSSRSRVVPVRVCVCRTDRYGNTALRLAVQNEHELVQQVLRGAGATR